MAKTLGWLRGEVLRWLGDPHQQVWTQAEVDLHLRTSYQQLAHLTRVFWDQRYLENLPQGFSYTVVWELAYADFDYGLANYTYADERRALDEDLRIGPANHTSPFEATGGYLSDGAALTAIPATVDLPDTVTELETAYWDQAAIDAMTPRPLGHADSRYELTTGEVFGYLWRQDGIRTFRKVRVPAAQAATFTITGSFGVLRLPTDLSAVTVTGTWGVPRRIPGQHPMGPESWGLPRRPYRDGTNVRIEHWREGRRLDTTIDRCELPDHYARYLKDYALGQCLRRAGPGQNLKLAQHFDQRWQRDLVRVKRRGILRSRDRVGRLGESLSPPVGGPPRPRLPWNYGRVVQ